MSLRGRMAEDLASLRNFVIRPCLCLVMWSVQSWSSLLQNAYFSCPCAWSSRRYYCFLVRCARQFHQQFQNYVYTWLVVDVSSLVFERPSSIAMIKFLSCPNTKSQTRLQAPPDARTPRPPTANITQLTAPADRFFLSSSSPKTVGASASLGIKSPSFSAPSPFARAFVDGFLRLRTLTPREELSLALDMIELERVWVGVEFDSLLLVAELVRAVRPAAMAIREISTP